MPAPNHPLTRSPYIWCGFKCNHRTNAFDEEFSLRTLLFFFSFFFVHNISLTLWQLPQAGYRCRAVPGSHDGVSAIRCSRWVVGRLAGSMAGCCWCWCWWRTCSGDVTSCRMWRRRMAVVVVGASAAGIGLVASRLRWVTFGASWGDSTSRKRTTEECEICYRCWSCCSWCALWWANYKSGRCCSPRSRKWWGLGCFALKVDASSRWGVAVWICWFETKPRRKDVVNWMRL